MKPQLFVVLDNVRSRENVGSIFRTADAAGISKIFLCGITPRPIRSFSVGGRPEYDQKISKTALGAEKLIPWEYYTKTWQILCELKSLKFKVIGLEKTKKSTNIFKFKKHKNCSIVLVVGNEVKGLSPKILKYADQIVKIPMFGKKESLNVAVAFGIAVYAITNQNS